MLTRAELLILLSLTVGAIALPAGAAQAADNTRYISITGSNANACTLTAPCRTFQRGVNVTPAGGELRILDSGDFGVNATIKKSLTVTGNGHTVYLGKPITIDDAEAVVALRGLVLNGQGIISTGVNIAAGSAVHIERCVIHNFSGTGIEAAGSTEVELFVFDTTSRDNGGHGLLMAGAAGARATIDNSRFDNNHGTAILVLSGDARIRGSTVSGNVSQGIFVDNATVSVVSTMTSRNPTGLFVKSGGILTVESSLADGNGTGLFVTGSTARISNSTFTRNNNGIVNNGVVETRSNNTVRGNTIDLSGSALTPLGGV